MIKIRSNVFETNSSSTHSITIVIANDDVNFQFNSNGNNKTEWTNLNN